ncbi:MAG: DUF2809 domain-containing protein [candidate division KSB1 bacterium]|nr:DUF2809 domain-containing protein [candidate division KSB1 bacterium]MDZ7402199.1 DUF2809 domain-containing protein [candidate division KSB1 bacterium]
MTQFHRTALSILIITPIGFASKFYRGPSAAWVNDSLAGMFYVIFWCLVVFLFFPDSKPWKIAAVVLAITCLLEFLQLWHPPFLEWVRSSFIGATILGTSFVWSDFPYYFLGSAVGWLWLRWIKS